MRAAGLVLASLAPPGMAWAAVAYAAGMAEAEAELGIATFTHWAVRGWLDNPPTEGFD